MKKLPFYIAIGIAVAAVSALIISELRRRNQVLTPANLSGGQDYLFSDTSYAAQTFRGFNLNLTLNGNTHQGTAEITALQHMINAYMGGTPSLSITGKWDAATRAAVKDITGKGSTSLFEFTYHYLIPQRGEKAGTDILMQLTTNNKG